MHEFLLVYLPASRIQLQVSSSFILIDIFILTPRRDPRAAWKYPAFRTAILHSQLRSGSFSTQRNGLDDRLTLLFLLVFVCLTLIVAPGIYHGTLNYESNSDDLIDAAQLLPYPPLPVPPISPGHEAPTSTEIPTSIALTEFHFILLYKNSVVGICNLDEKLAYEEVISLVSAINSHLLFKQRPTITESKRRSSWTDGRSRPKNILGVHESVNI
jgi:Pep3/Vps18/deep orange family